MEIPIHGRDNLYIEMAVGVLPQKGIPIPGLYIETGVKSMG